jgi:hypothetical protein
LEGAHASCPPTAGPPAIRWLDAVPIYPFKIIQQIDLVVILYEHLAAFRQIFLDRRELPKDLNPVWLGYSVGHWDEDSLAESAGFNGKT